MDMQTQIKDKLGKRIKDWYQHSAKRYYLVVEKEDIVDVAKILFKDLGLRFAIATGVDTRDAFEILYHFSFDKTGEMFSARVLIKDKKNPEIDSLANLFPAASWIEREIWEMLGINFKNHPNLIRLLLADEWPEGNYPLRQE